MAIELYLQDNSVYDGDISNGTIKDPGVPYFLAQSQEISEDNTENDDADEQDGEQDDETNSQTEVEPSTSGTTTAGPDPTKETATDENPEEILFAATTEVAQTEILEITSTNNENNTNRFTEETTLLQGIQEESVNSLVQWADSSGLINTATNNNSEAGDITDPDSNTAASEGNEETARPLAFVSDALNRTPGNQFRLLETLILGGGLLYALDRASGNLGSSWFKRLLTARSGYLVGGIYERVITVFRAESRQGLDQIVAAKITDERLEILAEQQLPMDLAAASAINDIDLTQELEQLIKKVTDENSKKGDLLLYDPRLQNELSIFERLGEKHDVLKPQKLHKIVSQLKENELAHLEQWLKKPSKLKNKVSPVKDYLQARQSQLRKKLSHEKSVMVSVLELSLAMGKR